MTVLTLAAGPVQEATADATWSLGVLLWLPVLLICLIVLIVVTIAAATTEDGLVIGGMLTVLLVLPLAGGIAFGYYPYSKQYHSYADVAGTVEVIEARLFVDAGEKFVVRFEGSPQQYGCSDTRCALVEPGDALALSCRRVFEYAAEDGYDCRFVGSGAQVTP